MPGNNKIKKVGYSDKSKMPPLGILSIASYLMMHGYEVKCIDLLAKPMGKQEFEEMLKDYQPDIVGISTYTETFKTIIQMSKLVKQVLRNAYMILGGPHVSFLPEEALAYDEIDFVSRGEGEVTLVQLIEALNYQTMQLKDIKGLSYRLQHKIINNEQRGFIIELDSLPWYELDDIEKEKYNIKQLIITSRGCPGQCVYCASAALSGRKYRRRSAENVFAEVFYKYHAKGERYFAFLDDTFTANKKRIYDFCNYVINSGIDIVWRCDSRADILSNDMVDKIKMAGCVAVHIGIESGNQDVLDQIRKKIDLNKAEQLIAYMASQGLQIMGSFIIGHHCDTHETIQQTIALARKLKEQYNVQIGIGINTPFPGTELYNNMDEWGVSLELKNWASFDLVQAIISTKYLNRAELQNYIFEVQHLMGP